MRSFLLISTILTGLGAGIQAQTTTLVGWTDQWDYMHPMGALPGRPAGGADADFAQTWYLAQAAFAVQYDGPVFGATPALVGIPGTTTSYDSGKGNGPLGYGAFDYMLTPLPAPAEFSALGKVLTLPNTGFRNTAYFRTTFTVPSDGLIYSKPIIRYILEDGGYVYLDGDLILEVNVATGAADTYLQAAASTTNTESHIRTADLTLDTGSTTGSGIEVIPNIAGNATLRKRITSLTPGLHTLAVSSHNQANNSSDLGMALQLVTTPASCAISGTSGTISRNLTGTPDFLSDDTVNFSVTVTGSGSVSPAGWKVIGPVGSSLIGLTGTYGALKNFTNIPIIDFPPTGLLLELEDAGTAGCVTTVPIATPLRIGTNSIAPGIIITSGVPSASWVINETDSSMTLNNSGAGTDRIITSEVINLTGVSGAVKFSGTLEAQDSSSGFEAADTFVAELLLSDGSRISLVTPWDIDGSGKMNGGTTAASDEFNFDHLAIGNYTSTFPLTALIPDNITSAQLIIRGVNDSANESISVRDLRIEVAPHAIGLIAGPVVYDNHNTPDPTDDSFTVPVSITVANPPPGSNGWTSNQTPASGLYSATNPVIFGPFPVANGPQDITLADNPVTSVVSNTVTANPPGPSTVSAALVAGSAARIENGEGADDDTITFLAAVTGKFAGPGYSVSVDGGATISQDGVYSADPVSFTVSSLPLTPGNLTVTFTDISYGVTATVIIPVSGRYVIGQKNFGGGLAPLLTAVSASPAVEWVNDPGLRTLTMSTGGTTDKIVSSGPIDLSGVGEVTFSMNFNARDSSVGSNFEATDRFKAELVIDGATTNLISAFDTGNGALSTAGPNGPPNGYLNGYQGAGAVNTEITANYNLNVERDEFNRLGETAETMIDNTFEFTHIIPAGANSVELRIYGTGISGSEFFTVSNILFNGISEPDADSDGMPDAFEMANGLNPGNPADAAQDADADGQSNLAEYRAGTGMRNPSSTLRVTSLVRNGGSVAVNWASVAGRNYQIQVSPTLPGTWIPVGAPIAGNPSAIPGPDFGTQSVTVTLPVPLPSRYYMRIAVP